MVKQKQKIKKKVVAKKKGVGKKVVKNKPRVDLRQLRNAKKKSMVKSKPKPKPKTKSKPSKPEVKQDGHSMFDNERDIDRDITDASEEADKMLKDIFNVKS
jgi:hypothetical protein